jgi:hypothetical protein
MYLIKELQSALPYFVLAQEFVLLRPHPSSPSYCISNRLDQAIRKYAHETRQTAAAIFTALQDKIHQS